LKEWKAPEKEAQKMTRDGAVSVNLVTGETTYPSDRTPEQDHSASGDTAGAAGKVVDRVELHREQAAAKKKRRKQRRTYREGEAAAGRPSSRLQFSEADQAKPELQGAIRKSDKAADPLFHPNCHPPNMPIRCPAPSRRQAQPSTARSERWSRKIPASSRATWGNVALRRLWATETAVSRTGGRNAS
jgi:hypothetical protein